MSVVGETADVANIVLTATAAAVVYGVVHDLVTANVSVEYFSVAHPPVFHTTSPFLRALGWGVIATWWVGAPLGVGLAAAARLGLAPRVGIAEFAAYIVALMIGCWLVAAISGGVGAYLVATGRAPTPLGWGPIIPAPKHVAFAFDAWAHMASYLASAAGGVTIIGRVAWRRARPAAVLSAAL